MERAAGQMLSEVQSPPINSLDAILGKGHLYTNLVLWGERGMSTGSLAHWRRIHHSWDPGIHNGCESMTGLDIEEN